MSSKKVEISMPNANIQNQVVGDFAKISVENRGTASSGERLSRANSSKEQPPIDVSSVANRSDLRTIIDGAIVSDSDFNAFVLDFFPETFKLLGSGMDRVNKVNILLEREDISVIAKYLHVRFPQIKR